MMICSGSTGAPPLLSTAPVTPSPRSPGVAGDIELSSCSSAILSDFMVLLMSEKIFLSTLFI